MGLHVEQGSEIRSHDNAEDKQPRCFIIMRHGEDADVQPAAKFIHWTDKPENRLYHVDTVHILTLSLTAASHCFLLSVNGFYNASFYSLLPASSDSTSCQG